MSATFNFALMDTCFVGGEQVNGVIQLPPVLPHSLLKFQVEVTGKEELLMMEQIEHKRQNDEGQEETYYTYEKRTASNHFSMNAFTVSAPPTPTGPNIPVSFVLPDFPGSIVHNFKMHGYDCYAKIQYTVTVSKLEDQNQKIAVPLTIVQSPGRREVLEPTVQGKSVAVSSCGCFGKGSLVVKARFPKQLFVQDEAVTVLTEVDNSQSKVPVKVVRVSFMQIIEFTIPACHHKAEVKHCYLEGDRVDPGEKREGAGSLKHEVYVRHVDRETLLPNVSSKHISVGYVLKVEAIPDACCSEDAVFQQGIKVVPKGLRLPKLGFPGYDPALQTAPAMPFAGYPGGMQVMGPGTGPQGSLFGAGAVNRFPGNFGSPQMGMANPQMPSGPQAGQQMGYNPYPTPNLSQPQQYMQPAGLYQPPPIGVHVSSPQQGKAAQPSVGLGSEAVQPSPNPGLTRIAETHNSPDSKANMQPNKVLPKAKVAQEGNWSTDDRGNSPLKALNK